MEQNTRKAIAYVRISSMRQLNHESPETQKEAIRRYAESEGIEILEWFYDEAKTAKNANREELQNMLKFAMQYRGKIDHVIVYKMSRVSRDIDSYIIGIKSVLASRGITLRSATEPIDDTTTGRFIETLLIGVGQIDNEMKSSTTIDNMKSLAFQGYWQHPPTVGYEPTKIQNDRGKERPSLKPNDMSDMVTAVLERFSKGDISQAELTRYAKRVGLRSRYGKALSEDSIHRILKNSVYAGFVSDKFTEYENVKGQHPALISEATYERNQFLLDNGKNSRLGESHSVKNEDYPLKGDLLCSQCDKPMYGSAPRTGNGGRSPRYHCARTSCRGKVKSIKAELLHDGFLCLLQDITPSEGILKLYKEILVREANRQLDNLNTEIAQERKALNKLSDLRSSAVQKYVEGTISLDEKNELVDRLEQQKLDVHASLDDKERLQSVRESDIEYAINFMGNVAKQWQDSDYDLKQRFQKIIFPEGLTYDSATGKFGTKGISALYRYAPTKKDLPESEKSFLVAGPGLEPGTSWL